MALTVRSGLLATDGNSYASLDYAEQYHFDNLHTGPWDTAGFDNQERSLVRATRVLDAHFEWVDGYESTVPEAVRAATADMALHLLRKGAPESGDAFESGQIGPISVKFAVGAPDQADDDIPREIVLRLRDYGELRSSGIGGGFVGSIIR